MREVLRTKEVEHVTFFTKEELPFRAVLWGLDGFTEEEVARLLKDDERLPVVPLGDEITDDQRGHAPIQHSMWVPSIVLTQYYKSKRSRTCRRCQGIGHVGSGELQQ